MGVEKVVSVKILDLRSGEGGTIMPSGDSWRYFW